MTDMPEIICERSGSAGVVILNRPKALNALTVGMVRGLYQALAAWQDDPAIKCVVVKGAGEKAFCAGGDVRWIRDVSLEGRRDEALGFWYDEYRLNTLIKRYPKPYISLIGGIVMGGGVGVSIHGTHRIAGDNYLFAMPEVGIGFFPDVGASYPLSRLPGNVGAYLTTTGDRLRRADAVYLGIATHAVETARFAELESRLAGGENIDEILPEMIIEAGPSAIADEQGLIEECFAGNSFPAIVKRVRERSANSEFAARVLSAFDGKSPTSMCVSLEQIRRAARLDFDDVMKMDYRLSTHMSEPGEDFYEGVRAVLVDKDGKPVWNPATLDDISPAKIEAYFAPLGAGDFKAQ